jgi:hypothetical protein
MFKRFMVGCITAMLTSPTLYAGAFPFSSSSSYFPWERVPQAAASAICRHFGLCFASIP